MDKRSIVNPQTCIGQLFVLSLLSLTIVSLIFVLFPNLDIAFSRVFWNNVDGFSLRHHPIVSFTAKYNYIFPASYLILAVIVSSLPTKRIDWKQFLFFFASLAIGPGLIVNSILKGLWGRARPLQTDIFSGDSTFSAAWYISDQCQYNCSFVSGHAAALFAFYAFSCIFINQPKKCIVIWSLVTIGGLLAGMGRIVEGKHFLSDVLIGGHIVWLVALACYYMFYVHNKLSK